MLAVLTGAGVEAEDGEKKPVNDAITATRQGLEALKTDSTLMGGDNRLSLPSFETPSLAVPASAPALQSPQNKLAPPSAKSASWLIDAMKKNGPLSTDAQRGGKPGKSRDDSKTGTGLADELGRESDDKEDTALADRQLAARNDAPGPSTAKDAPNPLGGYMAGWMTPHDFNLLLKPEETGSGPSTFSRLPSDIAGPPAGSGLDFATALSGATNATSLAAARPAASLGQPENPYLQIVAPPLSPSNGPAGIAALQPLLTVPPAPPPAQPVMETPAGAAGNNLPEILKRDDNAKYFPQLKHF